MDLVRSQGGQVDYQHLVLVYNMAIALAKTLQSVAYTLYITTEILYVGGVIATKQLVYQSSGHHSDGFVPMVVRYEVVSDATMLSSFNSASDYAVAVGLVEAYLVANVSYYSGGSLV